MRRHIWAFLSQTDLLYSFQLGLSGGLRNEDSNTEVPKNLHDTDLRKDTIAIAPSKLPSE